MARIQVLELPMVHKGEETETPFALIIDQVDSLETFRVPEDTAHRLGARAILVFAETITIPANEPVTTVADEQALTHADPANWQVRSQWVPCPDAHEAGL